MIIVNLDVMMARRKISAGELAERVGITPATTQLPIDNQGLPEYVCVFPALMQACLFFGPTGGPWPPALLLTCGDHPAEAQA